MHEDFVMKGAKKKKHERAHEQIVRKAHEDAKNEKEHIQARKETALRKQFGNIMTQLKTCINVKNMHVTTLWKKACSNLIFL